MSESATETQGFFRGLTPGENAALVPRYVGEELEQFRGAGAIVVEALEGGQRVLVMRCGVVPRTQPDGFVSGEPRVFARTLNFPSQSEVVGELVESSRNAARRFVLERGGG